MRTPAAPPPSLLTKFRSSYSQIEAQSIRFSTHLGGHGFSRANKRWVHSFLSRVSSARCSAFSRITVYELRALVLYLAASALVCSLAGSTQTRRPPARRTHTLLRMTSTSTCPAACSRSYWPSPSKQKSLPRHRIACTQSEVASQIPERCASFPV